MPEWLIGFIGGVLATILGFALTLTWEIINKRKEAKDLEKRLERLVAMELTENRRILYRNRRLLEDELQALDENKLSLISLTPFRMGFWELLKNHLPLSGKYGENPAALCLICIVDLISEMNETIRNRETFKIHNMGTVGFVAQLRKYDEWLSGYNQMLLEKMDQVDPEAKEFQRIAEQLLERHKQEEV